MLRSVKVCYGRVVVVGQLFLGESWSFLVLAFMIRYGMCNFGSAGVH